MKHILFGIFWGTVALPFAKVIYYLLVWYVFGGNAQGSLTSTNLAMIAFSDVKSIAGTAIILTLYATPIFFLSRLFGNTHRGIVAVFAILPWVILDLYVNRNLTHFIEYSWYSLVCGFVYWHFASQYK